MHIKYDRTAYKPPLVGIQSNSARLARKLRKIPTPAWPRVLRSDHLKSEDWSEKMRLHLVSNSDYRSRILYVRFEGATHNFFKASRILTRADCSTIWSSVRTPKGGEWSEHLWLSNIQMNSYTAIYGSHQNESAGLQLSVSGTMHGRTKTRKVPSRKSDRSVRGIDNSQLSAPQKGIFEP